MAKYGMISALTMLYLMTFVTIHIINQMNRSLYRYEAVIFKIMSRTVYGYKGREAGVSLRTSQNSASHFDTDFRRTWPSYGFRATRTSKK